jgi:uncharacterized protein
MVIIDAHAYVGESLFGLHRSPLELLDEMDRLGIGMAILCPNRPKAYALKPANELASQMISHYPTRFLGMARVDPWQGQAALEDLRQAHEEFGLHGLLLHPWEEQFQVSDHMVDPLITYAECVGMPVMIECGYPLVSHPLDIAELANRHPGLKLIATHGLQLDSAGFALTDAELVMHECQNIFMETSGMYAPETIEKLAHDLGAKRIIFGSHSPWLNQELELERVKRLALDPCEKNAILGENILYLLGVKSTENEV